MIQYISDGRLEHFTRRDNIRQVMTSFTPEKLDALLTEMSYNALIDAVIATKEKYPNINQAEYAIKLFVINSDLSGFTNDNKLYLGKISAEEAINMGIRDAVEFGPFLIVNGKSAFINGNGGYGIHPRSAIAQRKDGIVLFLVIDGRSLKSKGADMNDLVDILLRYHAYNASNLDGGNSSALVIDNKIINHPINWDNLEQTRPIPCGFVVIE